MRTCSRLCTLVGEPEWTEQLAIVAAGLMGRPIKACAGRPNGGLDPGRWPDTSTLLDIKPLSGEQNEQSEAIVRLNANGNLSLLLDLSSLTAHS